MPKKKITTVVASLWLDLMVRITLDTHALRTRTALGQYVNVKHRLHEDQVRGKLTQTTHTHTHFV